MLFLTDISGGTEEIPVSFVNDVDSSQLPGTWTYSAVNVPGVGADVSNFETGYIGCTCHDGICSKEPACQCILFSGAIECGDFCTCRDRECGNRVVQRGVGVRLQVFRTLDRGFGIRTMDPVKKGSFVCEYASEVVGQEEALRRVRLKSLDNYLLVLKEHHGLEDNVNNTYFDPRHIGNVGRFLNHSCSPNLVFTIVRAINVVPRPCFYTARDIEPMEELTYNYGGNTVEPIPSDVLNLSICRCKALYCRGFLPFEPSLL